MADNNEAPRITQAGQAQPWQDVEYAGDLAPDEGGWLANPKAAKADPQRTRAAGPGLWGAPD